MLCSGRELGLSDDGAGLLVLGEEVAAAPGTPLTEALGLEADTVFDITVEGNRPDAWSISGIARDLAARLGLTFTLPEPPAPSPSGRPVSDVATAVVEDPDLCPRLAVSVLTDVVVGPSPPRIARRLTLAGMRPINNVVDASNYVMLERGQPTHPYDVTQLGGRGLIVRRARPGETLETLDGVTRTLGLPGRSLGDTGEDCLICDGDDAAVGVAGIMGGASSEISDATTEVLLEAAYFMPMAIARTSKRLGLRTEASARFERGCDPWGIEASINRFAELLGESVPGLKVCDGVLDVRGEVPAPFTLHVPIARVQRQIGVALTGAEIAALLDPIGFTTARHGHGGRGRRRSGRRRAAGSSRPHEPARCPSRPVWDRRCDRGGGPDVRVRQHPSSHADMAPTGTPRHPAAVAPPGEERDGRHRCVRGLDEHLCLGGVPSSGGIDGAGGTRRQPAHRGGALSPSFAHAGPSRRAGAQRRSTAGGNQTVRSRCGVLPSRGGVPACRRTEWCRRHTPRGAPGRA